MELSRYARHLALPEITPAHQKRLSETHIIMIGAGGLGAPALPYLAGAGIGHITIIDHDNVSRTNLHRQTIYTDAQTGQNKAELAAQYLQALNPDCTVTAITEKLSSRSEIFSAALLLDGTDNFETKTLLNQISIETATPLITASVNQYEGQAAILGGYLKDAPCYHCLFPALPTNARNCNETGVLSTAAGLTGLYQAHLALCFLLGIGPLDFGSVLSCDYKTLRLRILKLGKDPACKQCGHMNKEREPKMEEAPIALVPPAELSDDNTLIIDVRTLGEIEADPIPGALHMEVSTVPERYKELPRDKRLAFACASNMRSAQAAAFVQAMGYEDVCIYDKLAG